MGLYSSEVLSLARGAECMVLLRRMFRTSVQLETGHDSGQTWRDGSRLSRFQCAENFSEENGTGKVEELQPRVSAAYPRKQVADG
jgi:hypothetical protein